MEYIVCPYCTIGWVAGLAPTSGTSAEGWRRPAFGQFAPSILKWWHGGYLSRELCAHVTHHGGLLPGWALERPDQL